jgi:CDP-ribitol ribitolphosphotransferase
LEDDPTDELTQPGTMPDPAPALEVRSLGWERVQLVLRGKATGIDPAMLRLRLVEASPPARESAPPADRMPPMPPTGVRIDGDDVTIRFNVMAGPDQMPLEPGRWRLETEGGQAVRADADVTFDPGHAARRFSLARGEYVATPAIEASADGAASAFWLTVELALTDPAELARRRSEGGLPRRARRLVSRTRRTVFRAAYWVARRVAPRTGRRILFSSDSRAELGGNLQVVWDRMVERGLDREYEMLTLFKPSIADRRSVRDRLRMPWLLATANVILTDDYQPVIYRIDDPEVRIIQLWHASGAFKTVGYSRVGKAGGPSPYSRVHKNYTYAIVSSDHDVPFYAEAFGIPESRVVPTGIPRMDRFFDEDARAAGRAVALAAFPAARGRTTILFAPTFRGDTRTASYDIGRLDHAALHALAVEKDAVVIFKMHPFVREPLGIPEAFADRLIDGTATPIDVNDLLFVVDLLVTDYSSIVFEFSTLDRPMLFFAYDLDEYIAERDFYVPFEEFVPGRIVRTFDALLDAIRREEYDVEKVAEFARRHFDHLDGTSTDRVIDELVIAP